MGAVSVMRAMIWALHTDAGQEMKYHRHLMTSIAPAGAELGDALRERCFIPFGAI
jgi:hypothetical protein